MVLRSGAAFRLTPCLCCAILAGCWTAAARLNEEGAPAAVPPPLALADQPVSTQPPMSPEMQEETLSQMQQEYEDREEERRWAIFFRRVTYYVLLHIPMVIFMVLYKWKVVDFVPMLPAEVGSTHMKQDFDVPLFYCFEDLEMCLYSFFCGACRVGHTVQAAGILEYYPAIFLMSVVGGRGNYCFAATFRTYFRHKLRQKLGIRENLPVDCLTSWFCPCCAIAQEAKAVDQELGVTVGCCFDLKVAGVIEGGGQFRLRNPDEGNDTNTLATTGNGEEAE